MHKARQWVLILVSVAILIFTAGVAAAEGGPGGTGWVPDSTTQAPGK